MKRRSFTLALLIPTTVMSVIGMAHARKAQPAVTNKTLVRRFVDEVFNRHNIAAMDKYIAADYIEHQAMPGQAPGLAGFKHGVEMLLAAFPDFHYTIADVIAEGDKVVVRATFTGTQKGEYMGMAATGKQVSVVSIDIVRIVNGKAVEHWGSEDDLGLMQQLGAIPPPPTPAR